ncbi:hypothetical protein SAMN05444422_108184 [Halobiforma haloterrestris]|uniref:Uncharacterized protein n=1 Tax=Natronobacterium haloterrestre TaxID=148448 RepID=A0A1I1J9A3_NATHA|nr:hypothetical protein [Halobiforma haloterrestris]SFC44711.1 hypothetical protein SAMN05444422_108184 [Halobiforma haloterrestris]
MTELTIPPGADGTRAAELVADHVEVGDVVEVREMDRTGSDDPETTGEVTGIEAGYLELDGNPPAEGSPRYDEIHTLVKLDNAE